MPRTRDLTETQAATPGEKSRRTPSFTEQQCSRQEKPPERPHPGTTSEAAQERTPGSRDRDFEQDAGMPFLNGGPNRRRRHWQEIRRESGITSKPSDNPGRWHRIQDSKAESRHDDANPNTRQLGRRKGVSHKERIEHFARWHKDETDDQVLDFLKKEQDRYIANNYFKDDSNDKTES
jgi:hypothetical protein